MFLLLIRFKFLSFMFFIYLLFNVTKAIGSDFSFEFSIYTALKNSLELKAQRYRLASVKHSLGEALSSKDWSNSFTTVLNSSNKKNNSSGSFVNDNTTTSTISLSRNIFDGGKASEKYSITKDNIKLQELNLNKIEQKVLLNSIKTYLDVYSNQSVTRLRKRSLLRFKENVEATELKLEAGTVTPTVLAEAKSKLAKAKYELILAKGNLNNSISKFKSITKFKVVPNKLPLPNFSFIAPSSKEEAIKISLRNNLDIIIAKLEKSIAQKNIELEKTNNRPTLKLEFFGKDSQSSLNTNTSDFQSYGANITFTSPLFYNNSSKDSLRRFEKLSIASSIDLSEKYRQIELSTISSYQNYKSSIAKTLASDSEKKSSLLALKGIKKEAQFGIRTVLDVLDAEVEYLNASTNLIKSKTEEIFNLFYIKSILGNFSIKDIKSEYKINYYMKNNDLNFNILDSKMFN